MKVREIMTTDVIVTSPDDTLRHAAQLMADNDFGLVPVGENDRLVGMVTDRDIAVRGVAKGLAPDAKVRDVMTSDVKYVYEDENVEDAARNMETLQVRRLPVLNRDKRLCGIISLGDLSQCEPDDAGEALQSISQPTH
jgi:CBS domain-containing protein